jgi:hypothetical protein
MTHCIHDTLHPSIAVGSSIAVGYTKCTMRLSRPQSLYGDSHTKDAAVEEVMGTWNIFLGLLSDVRINALIKIF